MRLFIRPVFAALVSLTMLTTVLALAPATTDQAQAADAWDFDAGYIISDANFYDADSMNAQSVQNFLNSRVRNCEPWRDGNPSSITCLKDYATQTGDKPADSYCKGYSAGWQSAAQIIDGVARSCGISQKVLLVMLQKESALIDHTWPSPWRYHTAMGYGCPDGAPCDAQYYGLFNQVFRAAWQYKVYAAKPNNFGYRAGQSNYIQWNPNATCGGSAVFIRNQATASLYNYTPYQPNDAAKNAGYGQGDGCSSYGNRNFFMWYSDWFGHPTGYAVHGGIGTAYNAGGGSGWLGEPTSDEFINLRDNGASQMFQRGTLFWSPLTNAFAVRGALLAKYGSLAWENSILGYPTANEVWLAKNGGYSQKFQNGQIHWSPQTGAHFSKGGIQAFWASKGWENGILGYPTTDEYPDLRDGGASQVFQGGTVFWSPNVQTTAVRGAILDKYRELRWENSILGYPTANEVWLAKNGGYSQKFQNGQIHWSPQTGAHLSKGGIQAFWASKGWENGALGYPTSDEYVSSSGIIKQDFQGGTVVWDDSRGAALLSDF